MGNNHISPHPNRDGGVPIIGMRWIYFLRMSKKDWIPSITSGKYAIRYPGIRLGASIFTHPQLGAASRSALSSARVFSHDIVENLPPYRNYTIRPPNNVHAAQSGNYCGALSKKNPIGWTVVHDTIDFS